MRLDFPHRLAVVDFLTTLWTGIVFKVRHHVGLAFDFTGPVPPDLFDGTAAARWTDSDRSQHSAFSPVLFQGSFGRNEEIICLGVLFTHQFSFRVDGQSL